MRVERLPDGRFRIIGKLWSDTYEAKTAAKWEAFYRKMYERTGRADDRETADGIAALER